MKAGKVEVMKEMKVGVKKVHKVEKKIVREGEESKGGKEVKVRDASEGDEE